MLCFFDRKTTRGTMTIDEMKDKLKGIKWIDKEISSLYLELQYIDNGLFRQSTLTNTKVKTSTTNGTETQLVSQLAMKENVTNRIEKLTEQRLELVKLIDRVESPQQRLLLSLHYIHQKSIEEVGEYLDISRKTAYLRFKKALTELVDNYNASLH